MEKGNKLSLNHCKPDRESNSRPLVLHTECLANVLNGPLIGLSEKK